MRLFLCIGWAIMATGLRGQATDALELADLLRGALEGNYELAIANYESELAELEMGDPMSELLPHINFTSSYFNYLLEVPQYIFTGEEGSVISGGTGVRNYPVELGLKHNLTADLSLRQRIFDVRFFGREAGKAELTNLSNSRLNERRNDVAAEVAETYYRIQWVQSNRAAMAFNRQRLEQLILIVREQINNQMATPFDSARISKELRGLAISSDQLENNLALLLRRLRQLCKVPISDESVLTTALEQPLLATTPNPTLVLSPKAKTISYAVSLNELQQKATRLSGVPTMDFFGHLFWQSQSPSINVIGDGFWNNLSALGLQLSVPIYNGEEIHRETQKLKLEASLLELQRQRLSEGETLQLQRLQNDLSFERSSLLLEQEWNQQLESELDRQERRFQEQLIGINDLLQTQSDLMDSQRKINQHTLAIRLIEIQVLQAQGLLVESILSNEE